MPDFTVIIRAEFQVPILVSGASEDEVVDQITENPEMYVDFASYTPDIEVIEIEQVEGD